MIYLWLASLVWAFSFGLINTTAIQSLPPASIAFVRLGLAACFFLPALRLRGLSLALTANLIVLGMLQYGVMYIALFEAYPFLREGHLVALFTLFTPIYVGLFLGLSERHNCLRLLFFALVSVCGAIIILWQKGDWRANWTGFSIMQLSNVCFAAGQVYYRRLRRQNPQLEDHSIYSLLFIGAAIVAFAYAWYHEAITPIASLDIQQIGILLYLGFLATGICFYWWNKGAVTTSPATLTVMNNIKVPLATVVALTIFQESGSFKQLLIGGSMIAGAAILAEIKHSRTKNNL